MQAPIIPARRSAGAPDAVASALVNRLCSYTYSNRSSLIFPQFDLAFDALIHENPIDADQRD
jgi:hypothetical protein